MSDKLIRLEQLIYYDEKIKEYIKDNVEDTYATIEDVSKKQDKIEVYEATIDSTSFTLDIDTSLYKATVQHDLDTTDILVQCENTSGKIDFGTGNKTDNSIDIYIIKEENIDIRIISL